MNIREYAACPKEGQDWTQAFVHAMDDLRGVKVHGAEGDMLLIDDSVQLEA